MDFNEYKKLSQVERTNLEASTTDVEDLATLEQLKKQFTEEMNREIEAFKNDNAKVDQIIESVNLENQETVEKVKTEIGLDDKLNEMDKEVEEVINQKHQASESQDNNKVLSIETHDMKKGVDLVFEYCPELAMIGTKEQYSNYLYTVFPNSALQDIVYHGTNMALQEFKFRSLGLTSGHLIDNPEFAKLWAEERVERLGGTVHVYALKVNMVITENDYWHDGVINKYDNNGSVSGNEITIYRDEDTFLLGSEKDIDNFTNFVEAASK